MIKNKKMAVSIQRINICIAKVATAKIREKLYIFFRKKDFMLFLKSNNIFRCWNIVMSQFKKKRRFYLYLFNNFLKQFKIHDFIPSNPDLIVTSIAYLPAENNPRYISVPPIQTVKASSIFSRARKNLHSYPLDRLDFCRCHFAAENGEQDLTILPPAFVRFILTAKPSALVRRLCPAPPASPKEQDKGRSVPGRRGHLNLRHSPQTRMNTGFLGRTKPRRGAG